MNTTHFLILIGDFRPFPLLKLPVGWRMKEATGTAMTKLLAHYGRKRTDFHTWENITAGMLPEDCDKAEKNAELAFSGATTNYARFDLWELVGKKYVLRREAL